MTTKLALIGDKNYLKRDSISGSNSQAAPTAFSAWFNYVTTQVITHNLGFIPKVRVYYEPFGDGKIYPATGRRLSVTGPGLGFTDIICLWEVDATTLTIFLESAMAQTGTRLVYYVIYKDS